MPFCSTISASYYGVQMGLSIIEFFKVLFKMDLLIYFKMVDNNFLYKNVTLKWIFKLYLTHG